MSQQGFTVDFGELNDYVQRLSSASADFKEELSNFLEALGNEFLRIVTDEIIAREVVDTRLLLNSFTQNNEGNIWELNESGLVLEVGTDVEYARYVNDGHWTNPKGTEKRWVPGVWNGDKFNYDPSAKTGMLLTQQWVEGRHFWDIALKVMEKIMPGIIEKKLDEWLQDYFADFI